MKRSIFSVRVAITVLSLLVLLIAISNIPQIVNAAMGDISSIRVRSDGWSVDIDIEGFVPGGQHNFGLGANNIPSSTKMIFTVASPGFDEAGNAVVVERIVYGTKIVRKPYPNQNSLDEQVSNNILTARVSLSDFIYPGEIVTTSIQEGWYKNTGAGGNGASSAVVNGLNVINNSTTSYPKVVARWAWPSYERVTGDFLVEAVAFNRFAKNGKPIAAMVFSASDESGNTVYATTTTMTKTTRIGDANPVLVYAATIPVATLTQGDVITVNFKAYPWIGTSTAITSSDLVVNGGDGYAQPDERLGPLYLLNDKNQTYGLSFVVVDPLYGNNSTATTWVHATQAGAEAAYASGATNSYTTIGNAVQAIKAYNNSHYGRNDHGGGTVLLSGLSNVYPGTTPAAATVAMDTWLTITHLSTLTRAQAGISSGTISPLKVGKIKFHDITMAGTSPALVFGTATSDVAWIDKSAINFTGTTMVYNWQLAYSTHNTITAWKGGMISYGNTKAPFAIVRGNTFPSSSQTAGIPGAAYSFLGNKNIQPKFYEASSSQIQQTSENSIVAFNSFYNLMGNSFGIWADTTPITHGYAVVQNVIETIQPTVVLASFGMGNSTTDVYNALIWHNTFAGERTGFAYNSLGSIARHRVNWSIKGNIIDEYGHKDDIFPPFDGARVGGWPVMYSVGNHSNHKLQDSFPGDFTGLYTVSGGTLGYVHNASLANGAGSDGDSSGNGDYHLTSGSSALNLIPAGQALLPYDIEGNPRHNNGFGAAGAYEFESNADVTPPVISNGQPNSILPSGTTQAVLSVSTDEDAVCKYGMTANTSYSLLPNIFSQTGTTTHSSTLTGLTDDTEYAYYVRCQNTSGATNQADYIINFSVDQTPDTIAPRITSMMYDRAGSEIAITVNFTEAVSFTGSVSLVANTGGACSLILSATTTANCVYDISPGEDMSRFEIINVAGTITDTAGNALTPIQSSIWTGKTLVF